MNISSGHESSFVFSQILWLHAFFVYCEYIQISIFSLHSMAVDALIQHQTLWMSIFLEEIYI